MPIDPAFNTPGTQLNRLMDSLGFPDRMGDIYGAALDAAIGNNLGVARNLLDAFSPLSTSQLDRLMTGGFAAPGFIPRPHIGFPHHFACFKHTHYEREKIHTYNMGPFGLGGSGVIIDGKKINAGPQNKNMTPAQFEQKLMADPKLRASVEAQLGGRIVYDGKADGKITVARTVHHPMIPFHNHIHSHVGNMLHRCFQPPMLNNVLGNLGNFLGAAGFGAGVSASLQIGPFKLGFGASVGTAGQTGGFPGGSSDLSSILKNPNMSFEQKLAMFLFAFMEKKQKELTEKMEALEKKQSGQGSGGKGGGKGIGGGKGGGNPLGKIGNMAGSVLQIGGGVLGGMVGGPIGSMLGSQIGGAVGGAVSGGQTGGAQGKESDSIEMKKLEMAMQEMNKIFTLVDNMLKSMNDVVKQGPLAAIRG